MNETLVCDHSAVQVIGSYILYSSTVRYDTTLTEPCTALCDKWLKVSKAIFKVPCVIRCGIHWVFVPGVNYYVLVCG